MRGWVLKSILSTKPNKSLTTFANISNYLFCLFYSILLSLLDPVHGGRDGVVPDLLRLQVEVVQTRLHNVQSLIIAGWQFVKVFGSLRTADLVLCSVEQQVGSPHLCNLGPELFEGGEEDMGVESFVSAVVNQGVRIPLLYPGLCNTLLMIIHMLERSCCSYLITSNKCRIHATQGKAGHQPARHFWQEHHYGRRHGWV